MIFKKKIKAFNREFWVYKTTLLEHSNLLSRVAAQRLEDKLIKLLTSLKAANDD